MGLYQGLPQDQAQQLVQAAMQDLESQQQQQQFQMARGGRVQYSPGGKTEENWFDEPAYTKAFRYAPLIPSTAAIATGLQNKKRTLTPSLITAPQIDLERARINLKEENRRGLETALRTIRGGAGSSGTVVGAGGGGGAGGAIRSRLRLNAQNHIITIGSGGAVTSGASTQVSGNNTTLGSLLTAIGGGRGGDQGLAAAIGGSGGGGAGANIGGAAGTSGQGNSGEEDF